MFDHHKKSPWFAEKYDPSPEFAALRTRVRKHGWKGRLNNFLLDLEAGKFDPDSNEPRDEPSSVNAPDAAAAGEDVKPQVDDDMQFNLEGDEDGGANGKGPSNKKQENRGDELAVPPEGNQVMIRTIPPDIGRVKLEEVSHMSKLVDECSYPSRRVLRSLVSCILLWATLCRSETFTALVGFVSVKKQTWALSWPS
jgi:SERRATE/Ars2, N-terminal domain